MKGNVFNKTTLMNIFAGLLIVLEMAVCCYLRYINPIIDNDTMSYYILFIICGAFALIFVLSQTSKLVSNLKTKKITNSELEDKMQCYPLSFAVQMVTALLPMVYMYYFSVSFGELPLDMAFLCSPIFILLIIKQLGLNSKQMQSGFACEGKAGIIPVYFINLAGLAGYAVIQYFTFKNNSLILLWIIIPISLFCAVFARTKKGEGSLKDKLDKFLETEEESSDLRYAQYKSEEDERWERLDKELARIDADEEWDRMMREDNYNNN